MIHFPPHWYVYKFSCFYYYMRKFFDIHALKLKLDNFVYIVIRFFLDNALQFEEKFQLSLPWELKVKG